MPLQRLQTLPTRHIPQLHRLVIRPRRNLRPIWRKRHTVHTNENAPPASADTPHSSHPTASPSCPRPRRNLRPIQRKRHTPHIIRMPLQRLQTLPTRHIPQLHRIVPDPDATFVPSGENDTLFTSECPSIRMPLQRLQTLPTRHIPQLHRLVPDPDATFVPSGENDTLFT